MAKKNSGADGPADDVKACECCGAMFERRDSGRLRYKTLPKMREGGFPPSTMFLCDGCWRRATGQVTDRKMPSLDERRLGRAVSGLLSDLDIDAAALGGAAVRTSLVVDGVRVQISIQSAVEGGVL